MVEKFWETVAGELAKRWAALAATAAALFWVAGVAAWGVGHSHGFSRIDEFFEGLDTFTQVALSIGALAVVMSSAYLMDLVAPTALRVLQGDLPITPLYNWKASRVVTKREKMEKELGELEAKDFEKLTAPQTRRAAKLDRRLHLLPVRTADVRLTALGNMTSASQVRPLLRFGLDGDVVWPAMWLVLSDVTRATFQSARGSFDSALRVLLWGMLIAVWTIWTSWALVVAGGIVIVAGITLMRRGEAFNEISEAAFALYRFDLYAKLGFPIPQTGEDDKEIGEEVTTFLWSGHVPPALRWTAGGTDVMIRTPVSRHESSMADELERLANLLQRGQLSVDEFVSAKQRLLG
jgi:hypothetical protein